MTFSERVLRHRLLLPALLLLGAAIAVSRGQDAAWDLKNYHLYNAWAFFHGRLGIDLAPASLQSYFNPLLDLPYFWLGTGPLSTSPRVLAALQGLWYGGAVFLLCLIVRRFAGQEGRAPAWTDLAAIFIGATGTMTLTQAGMSTNELPLAVLVMAGYLVAMPLAAQREGTLLGRAALAGLLCGLAAGLKPTAIVYAPALGFAVWAARGFRLAGLTEAVTLGVAALFGFFAAYGSWGYSLWHLTGNPIFPMFNQVFHSPWMPDAGGTDRQFMPKSVLQTLFYPFWWLRKNDTQGGNTFADARYALAMLALLGAGAIALARRRPGAASNPVRRMLFTFVCAAYVLWLALYSILRYAVPIEMLTGLTVLAAASLVAEALDRPRSRLTAAVIGATLLITLATTRYTDWGHAPFAKTPFAVEAAAVTPGSLVVVLSAPNAYVIPFVPNAEEATFVSLTWLNVLSQHHEFDQRVRAAIEGHEGPIYAILRDTAAADGSLGQLTDILPGARMDSCSPIRSGLELTPRRRDLAEGLRLCKVVAARSKP
ncbi:hypothetical protein L2Y96_09865 [Luteibacter aegosomaticola]|uniref:hypothetical protein n=1 Tax=Luteibacter aegosomaticola TaxID=2911538 RepID=UPI001FF85B27|nr:hypothetical protein [Luteibacter aegosomaticola]UPG92046.1 hypothetical protein L2Y96_09865 [Luteibacter aegosomaticola]